MDEFENVTKSLAPKSGLITRAVPWILSFALELKLLYLLNVKNINIKKIYYLVLNQELTTWRLPSA